MSGKHARTSASSLFIRLRRASGVERQQLQWVTAAVLFIVVAVLAGFAIGGLFPATLESGEAWLGAVVAVPTVPFAIGVAVLRYRLYEIDTIINRAIVYGLLTAILAGTAAAATTLVQKVFVGVIGEGSDVSIVVTTLIVVSAFNPIKTRLQSVVDRRFESATDPAAAFQAFAIEVRRSLTRPDRTRTLGRLLDLAVAELRATGGEIRVDGGDDGPIVAGRRPTAPPWSCAPRPGPIRPSSG